MKNIKFLALLPVLMLSACGLGTKLSDEKAQERIDAIKEKMADMVDDENYQNYKMSMTAESYYKNEDGDKEKMKAIYKLNQNADGEFYAYVEVNMGKEKTTVDLYYALDDEYEEVLYVKSYNSEAEDEKTNINVTVKKDNSAFDAILAEYVSDVTSTLGRTVGVYGNPETVAAMVDGLGNDYDEPSVAYYSGINGDFSVKASVARSSEADDVDDDYKDSVLKSATVIATYSKDVLSSFDMEQVFLSGDKAGQRGSIAYQKSFLKISLPNGWQNELDKDEE